MMIPPSMDGRTPKESPTIDEVLAFPSLRRGDPVVVAGAAGTGRRVRWVHVSEVLGIAGLLRGNELLLTTGLVIPEDVAGISAYIDRLADANVAALVIGLGPRFTEPLPPAMVEAANRRGLPLIVLRRTIAFIDVTEEVHASLVDAQVRELRASENIHKIFSALATQGSPPDVVLKQVAELSGFAVVLENQSHQVLALESGERSRSDVLAEWSEHTQRPVRRSRTSYNPQTGWLQTTVGARGDDWGRLILMAGDAGDRDLVDTLDPTRTIPHSLIMLIEQAASTLSIGRLVDRESDLLALNTHQSVLGRLLTNRGDPAELEQQAAALGVSLLRTPLAAYAIRDRGGDDADPGTRHHVVRGLSTAIADFTRRQGIVALAAPVDEFTVGVIAVQGATPAGELATQLVAALADENIDAIVAVAGPGSGIEAARANLSEVTETVSTATTMNVAMQVVTAEQLGVRGLIHSLRDDPRLAKFATHTLAPLVRYDAEHDSALLPMLRHFLNAGRNKTLAAQRAFVSRPWMHERLRLVSSVIALDLEDEAVCLDLQVALMIFDSLPGAKQLGERAHERGAG